MHSSNWGTRPDRIIDSHPCLWQLSELVYFFLMVIWLYQLKILLANWQMIEKFHCHTWLINIKNCLNCSKCKWSSQSKSWPPSKINWSQLDHWFNNYFQPRLLKEDVKYQALIPHGCHSLSSLWWLLSFHSHSFPVPILQNQEINLCILKGKFLWQARIDNES